MNIETTDTERYSGIEAIDAKICLLEQQSNEIGEFTFYAPLNHPKLYGEMTKQRLISNRICELQLLRRRVLAFGL
jgi:hypothetical protein